MRTGRRVDQINRKLDLYFQGVPTQGAGKPKVGEMYVLYDHGEDACGHNSPCIAEVAFWGESTAPDGGRRRTWYGRLVVVNSDGAVRAGKPFEFETYHFDGKWRWGSGAVKVSTVELKPLPEAKPPVVSAPPPAPAFTHAATELKKAVTGPTHIPTEKPDCQLIGQDGNVFNLIGLASRALKKAGLAGAAGEMTERCFAAKSYDEALGIIGEYVEIG